MKIIRYMREAISIRVAGTCSFLSQLSRSTMGVVMASTSTPSVPAVARSSRPIPKAMSASRIPSQPQRQPGPSKAPIVNVAETAPKRMNTAGAVMAATTMRAGILATARAAMAIAATSTAVGQG